MLYLVLVVNKPSQSVLKVLWGWVDDRQTDSLPIWSGLIRRANTSSYGACFQLHAWSEEQWMTKFVRKGMKTSPSRDLHTRVGQDACFLLLGQCMTCIHIRKGTMDGS